MKNNLLHGRVPCTTLLLGLLLTATRLFSQTPITVTGTIVDSKGSPLAGVSVVIKGSTSGTSAGTGGKYSVVVPGTNTVLVFTILGYQPQEISVGNRTEVNVTMLADDKNLEQVVVTGYSRQSKRDVTGAVSTVSADIVAKTPVADVGTVLQGRVAGVSVDDQGGPGETGVVRIRGFGTNGDNEPLYVIDGVQMRGGNNLINPGDIESINVLKDPSLTSLYGAQGGNGVIVITTKSGKLGTPRLEYNAYADRTTVIKYPSLMDPQTYANAYYGYLKNSGLTVSDPFYGGGSTPVLPDYLIERSSGNALAVKEGDPAADANLYNLSNYRILKTNKAGTDWFREVIKPSTSQSHQLSLSGATERSNYALTFGYLDNTGVVIGTYFRRYSFRVNTEFRPTSWLKVGENTQFSFSQGNTLGNHSNNNLISDLYNRSPLIPMYDIAGAYSGPKGITDSKTFHPGGNNPVYGQLYGRDNFKGYGAGLISSAYADVEPVKGLVFETKIGFQFFPSSYRYFTDTIPQNVYSPAYNSFTEGNSWSTDWRWTNKISYSLRFNDVHKIDAFVAYEARQFMYRLGQGTTPNLPYTIPSTLVLGNGSTIDSIHVVNTTTGSTDAASAVSVFGNVNYSLMDKYLFSFVLRRDGSSKFGTYNKYGNFPSVSAGWRLSDEKFMEHVNWVNDLKIRAAVGSNGNDAIPSGLYINQYNTMPYVNSYALGGANNYALTGVGLYQIGNPYIHWETNKTTNLGFDASLFSNSLIINFSWFDRQTKDLLAAPPISGLEGDALAPFRNIMKFSNRGFELEAGYNNHIGKFRYDLNFNVATYRNKVLYINSDPNAHIEGDGYGSTHFSLTRSIVGKPVSSFFGYEYEGIFQSADDYTKYGVSESGLTANNAAGHFKFRDINGDKKIDDNDRTFIGSPHPSFSYGLNINLYYANFDLALFLQGVQGNQLFNYWRLYSVWPGAQGKGSEDTWSPDNTNAKLPIWNSTTTDDIKPSSFFVEDGSYLRVKSLQLGYNIPKNKAFNRLRIYVQGFNLFTFTKYSGIDPEISNGSATNAGVDLGGNYPIGRKFLVGVNLGL